MLYFLAFIGGVAGLTWELLWMHYTGLSLGVSAQGAALTLVAFSLGTALGALLAGRVLGSFVRNAMLMWGALELALGLLGQSLAPGFDWLASVDTSVYASNPEAAPWLHILGVFALLALPSACMGATVPVFAEVTRDGKVSLARLYASNVAGASIGVGLATFVVIPNWGVSAAVNYASALDVLLGLVLVALARGWTPAEAASETGGSRSATGGELSLGLASALVFASGFATFVLEVAWFRSFRAAFQATTESFALVLFAVLVSLSAGGALAPRLRETGRFALPTIAGAAAVVILLSTPLVERVDLAVLLFVENPNYLAVIGMRLLLALALLGPTMFLVGIILPWSLEAHSQTRSSARLYAINTGAAVLGSLGAAWLLLPAIGFARTAWLAAAVLGGVALLGNAAARTRMGIALVLASLVALVGRSDLGRLRVQMNGEVNHEVLAYKEGPDATVSVVEHEGGVRFLVIDGFHATGTGAGEHYMAWMGHLPMMMHPDPQRALVICFGTGQTTNAVRKEGPEQLDVVDISESVFSMAELFDANEGVLDDPRVTPHVMDGRAWMRRASTKYDVITLEPMPPTFAGVNALYSKEFYEQMAERLTPDGVVAQWLPFHLVDPFESAGLTHSFLSVFPDSYLWIDQSGTGILLGRMAGNEDEPLFPGLARPVERGLSPQTVRDALRFGPQDLARYVELAEPVTDDNQALSYGWGRIRWWREGRSIADTIRYQHLLLEWLAKPGDVETKYQAFKKKFPRPGEWRD